MDILSNPFFILGASPRDNAGKLSELARAASDRSSSKARNNALAKLTDISVRLDAEIAWLPNVSSNRCTELLDMLKMSPTSLLKVDDIPLIARANLRAAAFCSLLDPKPQEVKKWIFKISAAFEGIQAAALKDQINRDRRAAGLGEITDISAIEDALDKRLRHLCSSIFSKLQELEFYDTIDVISSIATQSPKTASGSIPRLLASIIELYESSYKRELTSEADRVLNIVKRIRQAIRSQKTSSAMKLIADGLVYESKNWRTLAQPIVTLKQNKGVQYDAAIDLANKINEVIGNMTRVATYRDIASSLSDTLTDILGVSLRTDEASPADDGAEQAHAAIADGSGIDAAYSKPDKAPTPKIARMVGIAVSIAIVFCVVWSMSGGSRREPTRNTGYSHSRPATQTSKPSPQYNSNTQSQTQTRPVEPPKPTQPLTPPPPAKRETVRLATVRSSKLNCRQSPSAGKTPIIKELRRGDHLVIIGEQKTNDSEKLWYNVQVLVNGSIEAGWVSSRLITLGRHEEKSSFDIVRYLAPINNTMLNYARDIDVDGLSIAYHTEFAKIAYSAEYSELNERERKRLKRYNDAFYKILLENNIKNNRQRVLIQVSDSSWKEWIRKEYAYLDLVCQSTYQWGYKEYKQTLNVAKRANQYYNAISPIHYRSVVSDNDKYFSKEFKTTYSGNYPIDDKVEAAISEEKRLFTIIEQRYNHLIKLSPYNEARLIKELHNTWSKWVHDDWEYINNEIQNNQEYTAAVLLEITRDYLRKATDQLELYETAIEYKSPN